MVLRPHPREHRCLYPVQPRYKGSVRSLTTVREWGKIGKNSGCGPRPSSEWVTSREYLMLYRRPGFLAVVWFVSLPIPIFPFTVSRGSQRDVVVSLGRPTVASYRGGGGMGWGFGVSANEYSCAHGAQINFGDQNPYFTHDRQQVVFLSRSSCISLVEHTDGREGEGGGREAKSYDCKKAWPSINYTILSGYKFS